MGFRSRRVDKAVSGEKMSGNLRILMVNNSLSNGGAERVMTMLANELVLRGYEIDMLIQDSKTAETYKLDDRIQKIKYDSKGHRGIRYAFGWLKLIWKQQRNRKYDVVISFMMGNNVFAIAAGIGLKSRIIVSERCNPNNIEDYGRIFKMSEQILYPFANAVVFQTDEVMNFYKKSIRKKGIVIPNPVNPDIPQPYLEEKREKVIVSAGRLCRQKNYPMLLAAFKKFDSQCPGYVLKIYGRGELFDELKTLCRTLGIEEKVQFAGYVADVDEHIRKAAMFVMASDYEGISNAMMEALAMGVPTVCTDCPVGGARLMIQDGVNGLLVPVDDAEALAEAMMRLAKDSDYAARLGREAVKIKELYSIKSIADQWEAVIRA